MSKFKTKTKLAALAMAITMLAGSFATGDGGFFSLGRADEAKTVDVRVNGYLVDFPDQKPFINEDKRTMIPVRFVAEALGADVKWNGDIKGAEIKRDGMTIQLPIGSNQMTVTKNGSQNVVTIDTKAVLQNGRTLVPIRAVAETLGAWVGYSTAYSTVEIYDCKDGDLTPAEIDEILTNTKHIVMDKLHEKFNSDNAKGMYVNLHEFGYRNAKVETPWDVTFHGWDYQNDLWHKGESPEKLANMFYDYIKPSTLMRFTRENLGVHAEYRSSPICMFATSNYTDSVSNFKNYGYLTLTFDNDADIAAYKKLFSATDFGNIQPGQSYTYLVQSGWMINTAPGERCLPDFSGYVNRTDGRNDFVTWA